MENIADAELLKFPIGQFKKQDAYSEAEIKDLITSIKQAPAEYSTIADRLTEADLSKTYRLGSWNVKQLFHHVADIQLLHFFRMKKALTEADYSDVTLIDMDKWASTPDAYDAPVADSVLMLDGLTKRYVFLIESLSEEQLKIEYFHPVRKFTVNQAQAIAMSAWHLKHHLAHIQLAIGK